MYFITSQNTNCDADVVILHNESPVLISLTDIEVRNRKIIADLVAEKSPTLGSYADSTVKTFRTWGRKFFFRSTGMGKKTHSIIRTDLSHSCAIEWGDRAIEDAIAETLQYKFSIPVTGEIVKKVMEYEKSKPHKSLTKLQVYSCNPDYKPVGYHINADDFTKSLEKIDIDIPDTDFDWSVINTTEDYLFQFIGDIKSRLEANIKIMLDMGKLSPRFAELGIPLYPGQVPIAQAGLEVLKQEKFVYLAVEQGGGKSLTSLAINGMHFNHNYKTLVVAPTSTLTHWKKEISLMWPEAEIVIIKRTTDFIKYYNTGFKDKPTYFLVGKETFKLDAGKRPAVDFAVREVEVTETTDYGMKLKSREKIEVAVCPGCGNPIHNINRKDLTYLDSDDFARPNKSNYKCPNNKLTPDYEQVPCRQVLWQNCYDKTKKSSLIRFIRTKDIMFDSLILDEIHQSNNSGSLIGASVRNLIKYGKKSILLSGTTNNGYASSLHNLLVGLKAGLLQEDECLEEGQFVQKYGTLVAINDKDEKHKRHGKTAKETSFKEVEGVNPVLFTKYLAKNYIFAELEELRDDLPEIEEHYVEILPPAKLEMAQDTLIRDFKTANRFIWKMYENTLVRHYVNNPIGWDGVPVGDSVVYPQNLSIDLPKEDEMLKIVKKEIAEGRKVCIYTDFTGEDTCKYVTGLNPAKRIISKLQKEGIRVYWLKQSVKAFDRKEHIDSITNDYDVIVSNPVLVQVGVNLQAFPTYINYIPSYMVNTVDQSNRRGFRINSTLDNRIFHLYYKDTCEDDIIKRYQLKKAESKAIESKFKFEIQSEVRRTASGLSKRLNDVLTT